MEPLRLKPRLPVEDTVENWDDDDFMIDQDDLTFRSSSASTNHNTHRRDSHSSFRSDRESLPGNDERHVHVPGDDEKSTLDAIAAAGHAGIPIPANVPSSALMGGTIKRLGGRKMKKIFQEDWGDDLELPAPGQALRIKPQDNNKFPDAIRQVSGSSTSSPSKPLKSVPMQISAQKQESSRPPTLTKPINLDQFMDGDDDDDVFGDGTATIKPSKLRPQSKPISLITPPTPQKKHEDDFEDDLELPSDGKLKLSCRRDIPKTPVINTSDDFDWGEGSLGTRFGGTRREAFSTRSSSVSALSPSIASSMTAESEDEHLDGLELPQGPLDFGERLKRRKLSKSPERSDNDFQRSSPKQEKAPATEREDPLAGLDVGNGDVFRSSKTTLHRNVKVMDTRPASPNRPKTAVSLTFSNKPSNTTTPASRLPRPMGSHERTLTQPSLEPVSESGGPIPSRTSFRSNSRFGHSAQSSVSSIHGFSPQSPSPLYQQPSTPRKIGQKASTGTLRPEPTTTSAQLLRLKRSLPVMRPQQSPAKQPVTSTRTNRPSSRTDTDRPQSSTRPRTPVERARAGHESSAAQARKAHVPFLPAGASSRQSQNVNARSSRVFRRHDSDQGPEIRPLSRAYSRSALRSPSPRRTRNEKMSNEPIWQQLSKPRRMRQFGDGHELDGFDDLPTSAQTESKYTKQPVGSGNRTNTNTSIRNKMYQNVLPDRNTPSPVSPYSPSRTDSQPRFARDTAASRRARETSLAQRAPQNGPLVPLTTQRVSQLSKPTLQPGVPQNSIRSKKTKKPVQLKPHLISNLNTARDPKVVNGMTYNPATFRWEGNENALSAFNAPASSPSATSLPPHVAREKETSTPGPVLIKDMSSSKGAKRIGDMVFDPQNMCWLKVDTSTPTQQPDVLDGFNAIDDEDDPFKDIPDLDDKDTEMGEGTQGRVSDIKDDWLVGEEFDVGPEFIRRQREEEERWRKKCEKWIGAPRDTMAWRWTIKNMISEG